jgi:hypothetical protein
MLTTRIKLEIAGALIALVVLGMIGGSWLGAREEGIRMKATLNAQQQIIATSAKQAKDIQDAEAERDKVTAANVAALQAAAARQTTPAEIAAWLPKQIQTPQPITFTIPQATAQNPTPAAIASIPQADLPALRDEVTQCQVCAQKLSGAQSDLASEREKEVLAGEQLSAMTKERDAAVTAAKGGSIWRRIGHDLKVIGITVGIAAAVACGTGHCK